MACVASGSQVFGSGMASIPETREQRKVLIVDDERAVLETLSAMLTAAGYRVACVPSGDGALASARLGKFDAALVDIFMPGMDGFETALRLRAQSAQRGRPLRIWHMTGMNTPEIEARSARSGVMGLLAKPFNFTALCEVLEAGFSAPLPTAPIEPVSTPTLPKPGKPATRSAEKSWDL
jgi:CheY-like chemotaxis protein